jgi:hypothetical protein
MINRIESGMIHVNDALARQDRRPRRRLRRREPASVSDDSLTTGDPDRREVERAKLDLVA